MIILLNGTSSSGKTSIARELLEHLTQPYFLFGVDQFLSLSMPKRVNFENEADFKLILRSISGFNRSLKPIAEQVDFMIIDHVLHHRDWLTEIADALADFSPFFVGVVAPLGIIEEREKGRSDRKPGTARGQIEQMQNYQYDLRVDTSIHSPAESAQLIISALKPGNALRRYARSSD